VAPLDGAAVVGPQPTVMGHMPQGCPYPQQG